MSTVLSSPPFPSISVKAFNEIVRERRATRHFEDVAVPDAVIQSILEAGAQAPSGYNIQPWRFLVVRDPANRARLRKASFDQQKITEASAVIIAFAPRKAWKETLDEVFAESVRRGALPAEGLEARKKQAVQSIEALTLPVWLNRHVMIAFTFMMIAAEANGWDTAPMEGFQPDEVRRAFNLPADSEVIALLAIGRAAQPDSIHPGRLGLDRIAFSEDFRTPWRL